MPHFAQLTVNNHLPFHSLSDHHVLSRQRFRGLSSCAAKRSWFSRNRWRRRGFWLRFGWRCRCWWLEFGRWRRRFGCWPRGFPSLHRFFADFLPFFFLGNISPTYRLSRIADKALIFDGNIARLQWDLNPRLVMADISLPRNPKYR